MRIGGTTARGANTRRPRRNLTVGLNALGSVEAHRLQRRTAAAGMARRWGWSIYRWPSWAIDRRTCWSCWV